MMTDKNDTAIGTQLPILFTYRDTLFGNGFVVEVVARNGRALCAREADGFWMYGVNPGGMAAFGEDVDSAHAEFRRTFSAILKDLASEAEGFEAFSALVHQFVEDTNLGHEREWNIAVQAVREQRIHLLGVQERPADSARVIEVSMKPVLTVSASDNQAEMQPALAA